MLFRWQKTHLTRKSMLLPTTPIQPLRTPVYATIDSQFASRRALSQFYSFGLDTTHFSRERMCCSRHVHSRWAILFETSSAARKTDGTYMLIKTKLEIFGRSSNRLLSIFGRKHEPNITLRRRSGGVPPILLPTRELSRYCLACDCRDS